MLEPLSVWDPRVIAISLTTLAVVLGLNRVRRRLLRIATAGDLTPRVYGRVLRGKVLAVGDGDGMRVFHTPGGVLAGWGWLRRPPPVQARGVAATTILVRLAGVDAPEMAHFGHPAQPYAKELLQWLRSYVLGRYVWIKPLAPDQYQRCVARCWVLRPTGFKDVAKEMVRNGIGVVYEGSSQAQFDGQEAVYRRLEAEAKRKRRGLWGSKVKETPLQYKKRVRGE